MNNQKGQNFEREQCRKLSRWWSNGENADLFWRQKVRVTKKSPNAERQLGDVCCMGKNGFEFTDTFSIELKSGYSVTNNNQTKKKEKDGVKLRSNVKNTAWDLLEIIDSKQIDDSLTILNFWKQCESDAEKSGKIPLLIFKRDYHLPVVVVDDKFLYELIPYVDKPDVRRIILKIDKKKSLMFFRYDDFFEWITPEIVKLIWCQKGK